MPVVTGTRYDTAMPFVIAFKDKDAWQLAGVLGQTLAGAVARLIEHCGGDADGLVLAPVPSSRDAVRRRGFDHTATLAGWVARRLGLRWSPLLCRAMAVDDQVGQGAGQRHDNQAGTMTARQRSADWRQGCRGVIVIDDVITTGATAIEAVRALRDGGFDVTGVAGVADTPLGRSSRRRLAVDDTNFGR